MRLSHLALIVGILLSGVVHASDSGLGMGLHLGVNYGLGKMKNDSNTIPQRTMTMLAIDAMPGATLAGGLLLLGPHFEYEVASQHSTPANVGGSNFSGSGWLLGMAGELNLGFITALAGLDFVGVYKPTENDLAANLPAKYKNPVGIRMQVGFKILPLITMDVTYRTHQYGTKQLDTTDLALGAGKLKFWSASVGASLHL